MKSENTTADNALALLILAPPALLALEFVEYVWTGWVLSVLWSWFAVPYFGARPLTVPIAIGVLLVTGIVMHRSTRYKEHNVDFIATVLGLLLGPACLLATGWVVHTFFL